MIWMCRNFKWQPQTDLEQLEPHYQTWHRWLQIQRKACLQKTAQGKHAKTLGQTYHTITLNCWEMCESLQNYKTTVQHMISLKLWKCPQACDEWWGMQNWVSCWVKTTCVLVWWRSAWWDMCTSMVYKNELKDSSPFWRLLKQVVSMRQRKMKKNTVKEFALFPKNVA